MKKILVGIVVVGCAIFLGPQAYVAYGYFSAPEIAMSKADIEIGSVFSTADRNTFTAACLKSNNQRTCGCMADNLAKNTSRAERLLAASSFDLNLTSALGFSKGIARIADKDFDIEKFLSNASARFERIEKSCS